MLMSDFASSGSAEHSQRQPFNKYSDCDLSIHYNTTSLSYLLRVDDLILSSYLKPTHITLPGPNISNSFQYSAYIPSPQTPLPLSETFLLSYYTCVESVVISSFHLVLWLPQALLRCLMLYIHKIYSPLL